MKELLMFFTKFGLPREIQSDQGTNFTSRLFKKSMQELGVLHVISSAYHPQSQGDLERYHQMLKSMLRKYCNEPGNDWDKGVPFLLFATREVTTESLGFSPNELVFGHEVRGPLRLVKEMWSVGTQPPTDVLKYVMEFKERLSHSLEVAQSNLKQSQQTMKERYDKNAREREFNENDEVLVLLPLPGHPLSAKFCGPYRVCRRISVTDYLIETPDRRKSHQICHINMLMPYVRPQPMPSVVCSLVAAVERTADTDEESSPLSFESAAQWQSNKAELRELSEKLSHLNTDQTSGLVGLLSNFPSVFGDAPGKTALTSHDIDVGEYFASEISSLSGASKLTVHSPTGA